MLSVHLARRGDDLRGACSEHAFLEAQRLQRSLRQDGRKTLSEYISRAPFSLERMSFNEGSHTVLYRGEHFHPTLARNFDVSDPLEWIARITSHIPKKGAKQVIYYGSKPGSIIGTRYEALPMVVDTRLANVDSGGVLEQYVEDGCVSITK